MGALVLRRSWEKLLQDGVSMCARVGTALAVTIPLSFCSVHFFGRCNETILIHVDAALLGMNFARDNCVRVRAQRDSLGVLEC